MSNHISKLAQSLKQIGDIEVNDWDFKALLNKDIKDLEVSRSLRRLGSVQVMAWDFRTVLPAVNRIAHQEVDVIDIIRRTANYRVMEWDFRNPVHARESDPEHEQGKTLNPEEMQELILRLKDFLQYVVVNLIDEPRHAQIKVREIEPNVLRFKLILVNRDVSMLIGREGHTASAIRSVLQAVSRLHGVQSMLLIHSHETEAGLNDE
mgnify:CR=1 FL=1